MTRRVPKEDANGNPVRDAHGKPVLVSQMIGVKPVSVFDVSSTDGDPLPEQPRPVLLTGQAPPGLWESLTRVIEEHGFSVSRGDCGGANGITMFDTREVRVRADVDDAMGARVLAHEAAHVLLHSDKDQFRATCRGVKEVEAESVAFMVTQTHGLDASQYTFNYVAGWAHAAAAPDGPGVEDIVRATGQRVISATHRILRTTMPQPELVDEAVTDLAIDVNRQLGQYRAPAPAVADQTPLWERTDRPRLSGAVMERRGWRVSGAPTAATRDVRSR